MKVFYALLPCLLLISINVFAQEDHWEAYLAQYDDGPGSTLINMSLKEEAPIKTYPFLLKAGIKLHDCTDGLPTSVELKAVSPIDDKIKAIVNSQLKNKDAGAFTGQCIRTAYFYVNDTSKIREILTSELKKSFPSYESVIEIRSDPNWDSYLQFLYPNEVTMEYMQNEKVVLKLYKEGDDLSKPRQVDHWLYFKTEADRAAFLKYAVQEKYKDEGQRLTEKGPNRYALHLSRVDKVDIASISAITLTLRKKAREMNGDYDGWETFLIK